MEYYDKKLKDLSTGNCQIILPRHEIGPGLILPYLPRHEIGPIRPHHSKGKSPGVQQRSHASHR